MPRKNNTNKRRANNEGSIYQRKDGRWCSQITTGYKDDGKPIRKTIYSFNQQELLKQMKKISLDTANNEYKKDWAEHTFKELYMEWLFNFKKPLLLVVLLKHICLEQKIMYCVSGIRK